jgi:uncharacterized lipoprotein YmbA
MKKSIVTILAATMLVACGSKEEAVEVVETPVEAPAETEATEATAEAGTDAVTVE